MAGKKYKARKSKEAIDDVENRRRRQWWPWSELPPVTNTSFHLETNLRQSNYNNATGITKSWPPTTTRCNSIAHQRRQLYHVITDSENPNPIPTEFHRRIKHFLSDPSDVVNVEAMDKSPDAFRDYWCVLKSDTTTTRTHPPPTTPSNHPGPTLKLMRSVEAQDGPISDFMVYYNMFHAGRYRGISMRHECAMVDPFDVKKKVMVFASIVYCEGKYYAMSMQGALAVMEVDDTRVWIAGVSAIRAVPSANCRFFKEYVVVMKGEIWLVFLIYKKSLAVVDGVEVFRLDFGKLDWIKVGSLRGKTMFLKEKCMWVDSAEFGFRDDCVYFSQGSDNSWCVYDMNTCCISPCLLVNLKS